MLLRVQHRAEDPGGGRSGRDFEGQPQRQHQHERRRERGGQRSIVDGGEPADPQRYRDAHPMLLAAQKGAHGETVGGADEAAAAGGKRSRTHSSAAERRWSEGRRPDSATAAKRRR